MQHLFIDSDIASFIWSSLSKKGIILDYQSSIKNLIFTTVSQYNPKSLFGLFHLTVIGITLWELWTARNLARNDGKFSAKNSILHSVLSQAKTICQLVNIQEANPARRKFLLGFGIQGSCLHTPVLKAIKWICPPWPLFKLNTDGASKTTRLSGGGGVIRDSKGDIILAFSHYYETATSLIAEARALLDGLKYLRIVSPGPAIIECDSKSLVQIINKETQCPWYILSYTREMSSLLLPDDLISHIYREANTVADLLANHACYVKCNFFFSSKDLPTKIKGAARLDKLGMPSFRIM